MLALLGLLLIGLSVMALVYALLPVEKSREEYRPPATLFAPPQSQLLDLHSLAVLGYQAWEGRG